VAEQTTKRYGTYKEDEMILQTLFLLKQYGNSTIFTRDIYNVEIMRISSYTSHVPLGNVSLDAARIGANWPIPRVEERQDRQCSPITDIPFSFRPARSKMSRYVYNATLLSRTRLLAIFLLLAKKSRA